jgi:hypothetical protein
MKFEIRNNFKIQIVEIAKQSLISRRKKESQDCFELWSFDIRIPDLIITKEYLNVRINNQ